MRLTMWLSVVDPAEPHWQFGQSTLWYRRVGTSTVPTPGQDEVALWCDDDGDSDAFWGVARRYMAWDGEWHIELVRMLLDPTPAIVDQLPRHPPRTVSCWYSDRDGDLVSQLERWKWARYEPRVLQARAAQQPQGETSAKTLTPTGQTDA